MTKKIITIILEINTEDTDKMIVDKLCTKIPYSPDSYKFKTILIDKIPKWPRLKMCKFDEAFTEKEMLEETGYCKDCKMDCSNAGKTNND